MSGLTDDTRAMVEQSVLERKFNPELARIDQLEEAVTTANAAVEIALYQLREEAQFKRGEERAFDSWMEDATGEI